ncbi:sensor histidine kinase [Neolewinella agarilytica]|uniref:sensor histidine kinase n=1 Tax=Neolewinella agarilytica TaxID=478744 RepID=UPI0023572778|nr:sensor histidine kinase [Neolewinella agarilytica]
MTSQLLLLLLLSPIFLMGQEEAYEIKFISFEDGLPNRSTTCVAQDSIGQIWVGMSTGLAMYNGQEFVFATDRESLPFSRYISDLQLTADDHFRIITDNGTSFLFSPYTRDARGYNFRQERFPNRLKRLPSPATTPSLFFTDPSQRIFGSDPDTPINSTVRFDQTSQPTPWGTVLHLDPNEWQATEYDTSGTLIGKIKFPGRKAPILRPRFFMEGTDQYSFNFRILPTMDRLEELLWFLSKDRVASKIPLNRAGKPLRFKDLRNNTDDKRFVLQRDANHNLWLATTEVLWIFDEKGEMIADLSDQLNELAVVAWSPMHFFIDVSGNTWLSTTTGLFLISTRSILFRTHFKDERNTSVRGITEISDGRLLVGTYQKNRVIDLATDSIKPFCLPDLCWCMNAFFRMENGEILTGTYGNNISMIRDDSIHVFGENNSRAALLLPYYHSASKTYFFGTPLGVYFSSAHDKNYLPYSKLNGFDLIQQSTITHFHDTPSGLWIGSSNGLFLLQAEKGIVRSKFSKYNVKHFFEDEQGIFWIATANAGLIRWNPETDVHRTFTIQDGLTNNTLYAVYQDDDGYLWLPSNKGLMRFCPREENIISFHPADGIAHDEFNTFSHYRATDGTLYFGGLDGLTSFHPSDINLKESKAPLRINSLTQHINATNKIEDRTASLLSSRKIEMASGDKFFLLSFNLLDYTSSDISYAWKMEGVFDDWNYQKENRLRLLGLPYGTHQLRIKARASGSGWIDRELVIPVIVHGPFYFSLPFLLAMAFLLTLLTFGFIQYRTARLRQRSLELQREVAERTEELAIKNKELQNINSTKDRLFAMISHDLRAPLISLRGLTKKVNFLIERNRIHEVHQIGETVDGAVARTQKLLDNLLSWAIVQGEGFKLQPEKLDVAELLREAQSLYLDLANAKSINLVLSDPHGCIYADRQSVLTILRNLVDNAVKFTPKGGNVSLSALSCRQNSSVTLIVSDSGVGIPPAKLKNIFALENRSSTNGTSGEPGTGLGLILSGDLARQNNGILTVKSTPGRGSIFSLQLPAHKR